MSRVSPRAVLLVAIVAGSGCLTGSGPQIEPADATGGPPPVQQVGEDEVQSTSRPLENTTQSALVVRVTDANEQPIPKAFVSVVGTQASGPTNITGVVRFDALAEGPYRLRIDADKFTPAEVNVTLAKGEEKEIVVPLSPLPGLVEGGTGHFHDYWNGATEVAIFEDVPWDIKCVGNSCTNAQGRAVRNFAFPPGAIIFPGTGELEIQAKWSGTSAGPVRLAVGGPSQPYSDNYHDYAASGEKARFKVTALQTDQPHAQQSAWFIRMYEVITENTAFFQGPLVLSAKVFRGDYELPFDPPHPDEWKGASRARLAERVLHYGFVCNHYPNSGEQSCQAAAAAGYNGPAEAFFTNKVYNGASTLEVRLKLNTTTAMTAQSPAFHYVPRKPTSYSTTADAWVRAPDPTAEGSLYKWDLPVNPASWDPYYTKFTGWKYKITLADDRTMDTGVLIADMYLTVDAVKGP
ncbi:MAG: carboxypeptidase regulatory-like domain-containing protein [Euryarchaeota archaeon]|nr:carboxypeptidase regulatory-like domain-containing protein [Euryarchaeota archaeon]